MMRKVALLVLMVALAGWCSAGVVNDFESYSSTMELRDDWTNTANVTLELLTSGGHNDSQAMRFAYNNGAAPYYSKSEFILPGVEWGVSGVDWRGEATLSFWYKVVAKKEPLHIKIVDCYGSNMYDWNLGTVPVGDWTYAELDLQANLTPEQLYRVGRIDIVMTSQYYGAGEIHFDDFMTTPVPEPATIGLLGLGGLALLRKRG